MLVPSAYPFTVPSGRVVSAGKSPADDSLLILDDSGYPTTATADFGAAYPTAAPLTVGVRALAAAAPALPAGHPGKDFFRTGVSSLVLRNLLSRDFAIWQIADGVRIGSGFISGYDSGWRFAGSGLFDAASGRSGVVLQAYSGEISELTLDGANVVSVSPVGASPGAGWRVVGVADYNADGQADLLFQHDSGLVSIWYLNGNVGVSAAVVDPNPLIHWRVAGTGDFNGDGKADILFRNDNGALSIWEMDGARPIGGGLLPNNPGTNWQVAGTGDFNGDGRTDILFQDDYQALESIWLMKGADVIGGADFNAGYAWRVVDVGDYNGDGFADLAFQNWAGEVATWELNGTRILGSTLTATDADWYRVVK